MNKTPTKEKIVTQGPFKLRTIYDDVNGFVFTIEHSVFCEVDKEKVKTELENLQQALSTILKEVLKNEH